MIVLGTQLCAQNNLVPNGGFEDPATCPGIPQGNLMQNCFSDWSTPTIGSPDYYSQCSSYSYYRPDGAAYGLQLPLSGNAFIGMYFFQLNQPEGREYAQVQLTEPIHAGVRYEVKFYVSLAEMSLYAISSLGVYFSVDAISQNDYWVIDVEPDIQNPPGNIIADTSGWVLITDTFVSRIGGGEQFITIGNFNYAADSDTFRHQPINPDMGNFFFSYYYIDDVSVVAIDSVPSGVGESLGTVAFEVWPNPATDVVRFRVSDPSASVGMTVKLLDAVGRSCGGQFPLNKGVSTGRGISGEMDIGHLPPGIYFLQLTDSDGRKAVRKVVKE